MMDISAAQNLHEICGNLMKNDTEITFTGVKESVRKMLERAGVFELCGEKTEA